MARYVLTGMSVSIPCLPGHFNAVECYATKILVYIVCTVLCMSVFPSNVLQQNNKTSMKNVMCGA